MTITDTARPVSRSVHELKAQVRGVLRARRADLVELSHQIHATPELSWEEHQAAALVATVADRAGFQTVVGPYGVPTAVEATYGSGDLTVAICAEYDALPKVGHACGHNMIAAMGVGGALALAAVADELGLRIKLLGTPAEEHGGGKIPLLKAGAFEDAAFSLMVHGMSGPDQSAASVAFTAVERFEVTFTGRSAHAAGTPEKGINAGSAATLALNAIALIRQTLPPATNVNAIVTVGGEATNIIPETTVVQVEARAYDLDTWRELRRRVLACFEGAAIATGCSWTHRRTENPYAPMNHDASLAKVWDANLVATGRTLDHTRRFGGGSTDMGNVSQVMPTIHGMVSVLGSDAVPHNPEFTAAAVSPAADDAILDGAIALAWTVIDVAANPDLRAEMFTRQTERGNGATQQTLLD